MNTPDKWVKGQHESEDHDVIVLEVVVLRERSTGRVYSTHRAQAESDEQVALSWPSGGLEQAAYALLAEAIRREAVLDVILEASRDPGLKARYQEASPEGRKAVASRLSSLLRESMSRTTARLSEAALQGALEQILLVG